jgi:poly(A) polymerase
VYETSDELKLRESVLEKLTDVLREYAVHEGCLLGMSEADAAKKEVVVKTFGSYRLGVHHPDADIDAYVVHLPEGGNAGRTTMLTWSTV